MRCLTSVRADSSDQYVTNKNRTGRVRDGKKWERM